MPREAQGGQIHFYLNPALEQILWDGCIRLIVSLQALIPHTDRCHLGDSDSGPSKLPVMGNGQCLGYSRDGPKQPTSGF